ncbi:MAG: 30S ribosomal protein S7 [Candidatus Pacearchaeota archaeon]
MSEKKSDLNFRVFNRYDLSGVIISDPGLKNIINLEPKIVVKSRGRARDRFSKTNVNIIERLINLIAVPGHRGKKHKIITKWASGKYNHNTKIVIESFQIIEEKTGENPVQVLVRAVENAAPRDEVTTIQYGGAKYPQAVDCSPYRRVSIALRNIVHGAYDKSFNKKKKFSQTLAEEIIAASKSSEESVAFVKKNELEKQADSAR